MYLCAYVCVCSRQWEMNLAGLQKRNKSVSGQTLLFSVITVVPMGKKLIHLMWLFVSTNTCIIHFVPPFSMIVWQTDECKDRDCKLPNNREKLIHVSIIGIYE